MVNYLKHAYLSLLSLIKKKTKKHQCFIVDQDSLYYGLLQCIDILVIHSISQGNVNWRAK